MASTNRFGNAREVRAPRGTALSAKSWLTEAPRKEGSWWPEWCAWLEEHSGERLPPPPLGSPERGYPPLAPAPGAYVRQP